ncbi:nucleobase-ascorbate transporter LPE1 isoform X1 [Zea mays]|uniref:Nucleobase-ascorbate transporter LPE1 n=1 Tax=Zea mays TaxID=4577 RepID=A0A804M287_MAIZE|nr:nucleobase-ascorbate transporter LPE1 isoform X1 [Zea mays]|eukprot:XP_008648666.1 nucleobase-ascorbate transporter LPE1 isoform X1 [Zea mays]
MPPVKAEDLVVHAVKEQFAGLDYCITSPPPWITTVLVGFQHYLVMLGTTVLIATIIVPLMGGGHAEKAIVIQTILFLSGINTLLQVHFGTRLPAVMSGSYTYIYPAVAIILSPRYALLIDPLERFVFTMRSLQGALIIAGVFQAVVGFFGIWRVFIRFLSPLAAVPFVTLTGLGLFFFAFPGVTKCIEVGLPALVLLVIFAEYASHVFAKGSFVFSRCAVLVTVVIIWIYAEILTAAGAYNERGPVTQFSCRADRSGIIQGSPWVRFPYPFQWGYPIFCFQDCFAMLAASFASLIESTGTLIAVSRYSGATFCPPSVFSRGIGWEGISIILDGMCGTLTGTAASVENAGLLAVTRVGSRRVIKISALFMIFFSLFVIAPDWYELQLNSQIWGGSCIHSIAYFRCTVLRPLRLFSWCRLQLTPVLQPQLLEDKVHTQHLVVPGAVHPTVLPGLRDVLRLRTSSHPFSSVQRDGQCHLLIAGDGGRHTGLPSGLHPPVLGG